MRATYINPHTNPLTALERKYPQSPPLHLHFDQAESFVVATGEICTTTGYEVKVETWRAGDGVQCVEPWVP
jgi:hypothetical protein